MSSVLVTIQYWIMVALSMGAFLLAAFAFVEALRYRADAYAAAGKRTKNFWLLLVGLSLLVAILSLGGGLGLLALIGVVISGVFMADVRPALREVMGNAQGGRGRPGPYGPW